MRRIEEVSIECEEIKPYGCPAGAVVTAARYWRLSPDRSFVELYFLGSADDNEKRYFTAVKDSKLIPDGWVFVASAYDAHTRQTWFVFEVK